ncbi:MAG TPA: CBS domain-containing protein [Gammaproteobacteria bacterium]|nr:CBS domain-containing protein [Gammaproteobacteria bacterium]
MKVRDVCNRLVIDITEDEPIRRAAELMRKYHVGTLVVTSFDDEQRAPIGIVTDRDIVVETTASGIDPEEVTVVDIMSDKVIVAAEEDEVPDVLEMMRKKGVRRVPVVDAKGSLVGILAVDDLLQLCAEDLGAMAAIVGGQRRQESKARA